MSRGIPGGALLLNASGCLDALAAPEVARSLDAFVTKTITPEPREGNPPPRIAEVEGGMLNSIGLQGPGIDRFLVETLPRLHQLGIPIWVSVGGFSAREYAETCARLDGDAVAAIELNLSCPNVEEAPETAAEIVAACRERTGKPLFAKLSPATWDIGGTARAVAAAGADGLSLVNTLRGLALDERTLRPRLGAGAGGYSGPPLKPVALACVHACAQAVDVADRGNGWRDDGSGRARPDRGRRKRRGARHGPLSRPRCARADQGGAGGGCGRVWLRGAAPRPRSGLEPPSRGGGA